jgi:hypothetical protein
MFDDTPPACSLSRRVHALPHGAGYLFSLPARLCPTPDDAALIILPGRQWATCRPAVASTKAMLIPVGEASQAPANHRAPGPSPFHPIEAALKASMPLACAAAP